MRRGLLAWSEAEVPRATLDARVARCQAALPVHGLEALLLYTNFPRPAAVSFLTHFVPYWSQGALLVLPNAAPVLFVSLSKRVGGWIEETSHIAQVICTPRLGDTIGDYLIERVGAPTALGVLELARLPAGIAVPLSAAFGDDALIDAGDLFRAIRYPADDAEIAVSAHAGEITRHGFDAIGTPGSSAKLIAAIDGTARSMGAEEVLVLIAPDLDADTRLVRFECDQVLGNRCAVQVSVAYKGHWIRQTRTLADDTTGLNRFGEHLQREWDAVPLDAALGRVVPEAKLRAWSVEVNSGSNPLTAVRDGVPAGSVASVTAIYDGPDGPLILGAQVITPNP